MLVSCAIQLHCELHVATGDSGGGSGSWRNSSGTIGDSGSSITMNISRDISSSCRSASMTCISGDSRSCSVVDPSKC